MILRPGVSFAWFFASRCFCRRARRMQLICRDPDEGFEEFHFVGNLILFGIYCQYFFISCGMIFMFMSDSFL